MVVRSIVHIDQQKCDGCGQCVPSCEEGAIRIVDGKARVVSDVYCDGLGACLGHCPQDAISIVRREAAEFDQAAVAQHLAREQQVPCGGGCPGTQAESLGTRPATQPPGELPPATAPWQLCNWPVQLHLVPPHAPWLYQADLLLVADCVPLACANFHSQILRGRSVVIGCPKLDDCRQYVAKLAAILQQAQIRSLHVVHMEVPCCTGLVQVARAAMQQAGVSVPLQDTVVTRHGQILAPLGPHAPKTDAGPAAAVQLPVL